jgi:hypothetical protein
MYYLLDSTRMDKKYMIITPDGHKIHFGANGYDDYTITKNINRKKLYIIRHKVREDWTITGVNTAGFWSRWLLWNKPTIRKSIQDIYNRFKLNIIFEAKHN